MEPRLHIREINNKIAPAGTAQRAAVFRGCTLILLVCRLSMDTGLVLLIFGMYLVLLSSALQPTLLVSGCGL